MQNLSEVLSLQAADVASFLQNVIWHFVCPTFKMAVTAMNAICLGLKNTCHESSRLHDLKITDIKTIS